VTRPKRRAGRLATLDDWTERAEFLVDNLDLPAASGVEDARWEHFQLALLNDDSAFRIETKSRQIAWSFTAAAEAMADAILNGTGSIFTSINLEEATEKIRYARTIYDNLNIGGLPKITRDNQLTIELDNGGRLVSMSSRPPRGKARMNVYLDEFAHAQHDRLIYTAALPIVSKGGRIRIGSSPMGAGGTFWEVFAEELRPYSGYTRNATPWWEVFAFCTDVPLARTEAPAMTTAERVERFGNERIKTLFANMLLDDFQQEYECEFVDETTAWITWELIKRAQRPDLQYWHATSVTDAIALIPEIQRLVRAAGFHRSFTAGLDVGRKRDLTEFVLLGNSKDGQMPVRLMVSLDKVPFDDQEACFKAMLNGLPITTMLIDENGIGMQLAENLSMGTAAEAATFTNQTKELWAVETRIQFERNNILLPVERTLAYQIHSIKKKVSAAKNNIFDTERNEKHHADQFWALALAIWGQRQEGGGAVYVY
jgi:phage FluMu gp28-like protein